MSAADAAFWLAQAGAQLLAGALAWFLGGAAHRRLRISHAAFGYWLALWLLALAPSLAASIWHLSGAAAPAWPLPSGLPLPRLDAFADATAPAQAAEAFAAQPVVDLASAALALYLAGVAWSLARWLRDSLAVRRSLRTAHAAGDRIRGARSRRESQALRARGVRVLLSRDAATAFALGWPRRSVVVPTALAANLDDAQLALVLRHEAAHLCRFDPERTALMRLVQAALWFNPFLRAMAARVQLAAELRCDAAAIDADPAQRRACAQAYLNTLRLAVGRAAPAGASAFTRRRDPGQHQLRMQHMLHGDDRPRLRPRARLALVALALGGSGALAVAQAAAGGDPPRIAARAPATVAAHSADIATASAKTAAAPPGKANNDARAAPDAEPHAPSESIALAVPLTSTRITSRYGVTGGIRVRPHRGLDFAARRGTRVYAPAAALVVAATDRYPEGERYGKVVVLDHGDGWQTLYAHLQDFDVHEGQRIAAGAPIGRSGASGQATGPHLHMEVLHDGQRVDPEPLLR
ncbi:M23/M56 family metallopeptidase [Lysobacter enzymogenes]|uniref:M23/M56 family metallopeptidase n=1 Tax=Lysobacter enzymogenes TaxID=69 RepID=UPI00099CE5A1|nr:M23/M56 family metallopeptidase [Lysobacter enzymogenes]UZW58591.1 M23/M56 family metallopeptidase [Lysobacter enzymogenes]